MFDRFDVQAVHITADDRLKNYVNKKIGGLDKYLPRHARSSAHAEVILKIDKTKNRNNCVCEVNLQLPQDTIMIKERALNMFAAVDIVEVKLKQQLKKYKDTRASGKQHRRLFHRLKDNQAASQL